MADLKTINRRPVLSGRHGGSSTVSLSAASPASRISLRARPDAVAALSGVLELGLPTRPKTSSSANGRTALWLGPDEWLVIDEVGADLVAIAASSGVLHSAADVSHRNTAILVSGPDADKALNAGCPQDLSPAVFPVGACSRTLLGKAEVVVLRTGTDSFRVEVWRSFATYAFGLLNEGAVDAAL